MMGDEITQGMGICWNGVKIQSNKKTKFLSFKMHPMPESDPEERRVILMG